MAERKPAGSLTIAFRLWLHAVLLMDAGLIVLFGIFRDAETILMLLVISCVIALPALLILMVAVSLLEDAIIQPANKNLILHACFLGIALAYGGITLGFTGLRQPDIISATEITGALYAAAFISFLVNKQSLTRIFYAQGEYQIKTTSSFKNTYQMNENPYTENEQGPSNGPSSSNKILIKSIITAALVLVMLIPSTFVQNLITERQERQKEVVQEVSSKWALPQTLSAPYLVIPYIDGNKAPVIKQLIILPDQLDVKGMVTEESRPRSIYKVLLYKSKLNFSGNFHSALQLPDSATLLPAQAKLCFGLTDFHGIEEKITVNFNNNPYTLLPGLPAFSIDGTGLSAPVPVTQADIEKGVSFNMALAIKGSSKLHFLPLGANSSFAIKSAWPNPSFDGNTLPTERSVSGSGFDASWVFSSANLPFTSVITSGKGINTSDIEFGVTLVQPADQYIKSMRSAKYAILIIGLTFALFFIFELLQKKPVHPVQYVMVGMALVIFYTLLVSISEIILFGYAYTIAAVATIVLISLYAKSHFKTMQSALIFGSLLSGLYGFIYVLISLEDTALLVGSIALFIVLAIIMYATRKVKWY